MLGSRVLGGRALRGGIPRYEYVANRGLSEYHTGHRAFVRRPLGNLPLLENSDDFVYDDRMLAWILVAGFEIGELSCPVARGDARPPH